MFPQNGKKLESLENKIRYSVYLSSVWYLIKQLFHSRLLDISYDSRLGASHLVSYLSNARSWNNC